MQVKPEEVREVAQLVFSLCGIVLDESKSISKEEVAGGVLAAISLWMHATNPYVKPIADEAAATSKAPAVSVASSRPRRKARKED